MWKVLLGASAAFLFSASPRWLVQERREVRLKPGNDRLYRGVSRELETVRGLGRFSAVRCWRGPLVGLLLAIWSVSASGLDPERSLTQLSPTTWRVTEGLPQNTIRDFAQTPDGFLWFGTQAGLVRFDGVSFRTFDRGNEPAFTNHHVYSLAAAPNGDLWIGTNGGGLLRRRGGRIERPPEVAALASERITALEVGAEGELFFGTYGQGVGWLSDRGLERLGVADGLPGEVIFDLASDEEGGVWVAIYGGGVAHLLGGRVVETVTHADGLSDDYTWAVLPASDGSLWVGSNRGLDQRKGGRVRSFQVADGLPHRRVIALEEDHDGNIWLGTYGGGLGRWNGHSFSAIDRYSGLSGDIVWSLFEDREGLMWVGTLGSGLTRLREGPFKTFGIAEGLSSEITSSVSRTRDGTLLVATRDAGVNLLRDDRMVGQISTRDGLSREGVWEVIEDHLGGLWFGTNGGGLDHFYEGRWERLTVDEGLAGNVVFEVLEDADGTIWAGTNQGLSQIRDGKIPDSKIRDSKVRNFGTAEGLGSSQIRSLLQTRDGVLWVGTTGGLSHFDGETFETFSAADGLAINNVWDLYEDEEGALWLVSNGGGLSRFYEGVFRTFGTEVGLYDEDLTEVIEDDFGQLWLGSSRGVFRVAKADLLRSQPGEGLDYVVYGPRDGFRNSAASISGLKSSDGRVWFAHLGGVSVADPAKIIDAPPPQVIIERVTVEGRPLESFAEPLPHDSRLFEFHFTAPTLLVPEKIRLGYRLVGFDEGWQSADQRIARYNFLPPGEYIFQAAASNERGVFSGEPATFRLQVAPAFYRTPLAYSLYFLLLLGGFAGVHHLRVRGLARKQRQLAAEVEEALARLKVLRGLLPICAGCQRVRDEGDGSWKQLETYVADHSEASFSHGLCERCVRDLYAEVMDDDVKIPELRR